MLTASIHYPHTVCMFEIVVTDPSASGSISISLPHVLRSMHHNQKQLTINRGLSAARRHSLTSPGKRPAVGGGSSSVDRTQE